MLFFDGDTPEQIPADARVLLSSLLGKTSFPGLVEIRFVARPGAPKNVTHPPIYLSSLDDLREHWPRIDLLNDLCFDVYFACRDRPNMAQCGIDALPYLWVDIDDVVPSHVSEVLFALLTLTTPPTAIVATGAGLQAFFKLTAPLPVDQGARALAAVADQVQRQVAELGRVDQAVCNPAQVMRLPGLINRKPGRGQLAKLLTISDSVLNPDKLPKPQPAIRKRPTVSRQEHSLEEVAQFAADYPDLVKAVEKKLLALGQAYYDHNGSLVCRCPCPAHHHRDQARSGHFDPETGVFWCYTTGQPYLVKDVARMLGIDTRKYPIAKRTAPPPAPKPGEVFINPILRWMDARTAPLLFLINAYLRSGREVFTSTHRLAAFAQELGWYGFTAKRVGYLVRSYHPDQLVKLKGHPWSGRDDGDDHPVQVTTLTALTANLGLKAPGPVMTLPKSAGADIHSKGGAAAWRTYVFIADQKAGQGLPLAYIAKRLGYASHTTPHEHLYGKHGLITEHQVLTVSKGEYFELAADEVQDALGSLSGRSVWLRVVLPTSQQAYFEADLDRPGYLPVEALEYIAESAAQVTLCYQNACTYGVVWQATNQWAVTKIDSNPKQYGGGWGRRLPLWEKYLISTLSHASLTFSGVVSSGGRGQDGELLAGAQLRLL